MATVDIRPLDPRLRRISRRLWPAPGPVFSGGPPTDEDKQLALELWRALPDPWSRRWYVRPGETEFCGLPLTDADVESLNVGD